MPKVPSISLVLKTERKANNLALRYNKDGRIDLSPGPFHCQRLNNFAVSCLFHNRERKPIVLG